MKAPLQSGVSSNHTLLVLTRNPCRAFPSHEESCKIEGRFAPVTCKYTVCSVPILQDASVAVPKRVSHPSRPSLRRVAEALARRERSACAHATPIDGEADRFDQPTLPWPRCITCSGDGRRLCSSSEHPSPSSLIVWDKAPRQA